MFAINLLAMIVGRKHTCKVTIELCILERTDHVNPRWDGADSHCRCNVLVGFDLGVYIIGALVIWRFLVMVEVLRDFKQYFGQWKIARVLFATSYSWVALDVRTAFAFRWRKHG